MEWFGPHAVESAAGTRGRARRHGAAGTPPARRPVAKEEHSASCPSGSIGRTSTRRDRAGGAHDDAFGAVGNVTLGAHVLRHNCPWPKDNGSLRAADEVEPTGLVPPYACCGRYRLATKHAAAGQPVGA
ncbi:hypothetical protein [Roseomonas fluvialis]|uniref:Uncharacterized protein n=1 Tax=Roseomonas fluvialis TaxID=1750527 RepID=A0ABN6NZJ7_9PROT|nr:hypothetical protein [Roseomonas fluvialis]BDG70550.1 hypothetical protein Rmf_04790 [Roseomonas fluvialis]